MRTRSPAGGLQGGRGAGRAARDIEALNQHRALRFGLIDKPYSDKYIAQIEESLFASLS